MASTRFFGVLAGALLIGGTGAVVAQQTTPQEPEVQPVPPDSEEAVPHPIEPILVQGYVKEVEDEQLTLTAPGAPVDLPLSLHEETRYIQGENDVEHDTLQEGQLVRAALLPVGEDLVALVVEVVPDELVEEEGAGGANGAGGAGGGPGLQGETPPAEPRPAPESNVPAEPMPEDPESELPQPAPQDATQL